MGINRVVGAPYQENEVAESFTTNHAVDFYQVHAALGSPVTVTLDPYAVRGDRVTIQDIAGNAATQNITIVPSPGQTFISGATSFVIGTNYGRVDLTFNGLLQAWIPSSIAGGSSTKTAFVQSGNAFGATAVLGTTDANTLSIITGGNTRLTLADGAVNTTGLDAPGSLTIGGTTATSLTVGRTGVPVTAPAGLLVAASTGVIDTASAGSLQIAPNNATSLAVGNQNTTLMQFFMGPSSGATHVVAFQNSSQAYVALVSNTNNTANSDGILITAGLNAGGTANFIGFNRPDGTLIGSVSQNGATAVAYNLTSDARLKENVKDSERGLDILRRVRIRDFNYIGENRRLQGFIAQELMEVYPDAVTPGGDDPKTRPFSIDYGRVTPLLAIAIQELHAKHEKLVAEVAELRRAA